MEATTTYFYQATIINSSLVIQLRGNFTTGECELGYNNYMIDVVMKLLYFIVDVRLTTINRVLLGVGVILWSVASMVGIILIVVKVKTRKGEVAPL